MHDARLADLLLEAERFQRGERADEMAEPGGGLRGGRKADRRAHFLAGRRCQIGDARLIFGDDPFEERNAVFDACLRIAVKRFARGGDRLVDIGLRAERDFAHRLLGRGIDHRVACAAFAIDPGAIDILLEVAFHGGSPGFEVSVRGR